MFLFQVDQVICFVQALPGFSTLSPQSRTNPAGLSLCYDATKLPLGLLACSIRAAARGAVVGRRGLGSARALGRRRSFRLPGGSCAAPAHSVTFPCIWLCGSGWPEPLVLRRGECGSRGRVPNAGQPGQWGTVWWPTEARGRICPRREPAASGTLPRPPAASPQPPLTLGPHPFPCLCGVSGPRNWRRRPRG